MQHTRLYQSLRTKCTNSFRNMYSVLTCDRLEMADLRQRSICTPCEQNLKTLLSCIMGMSEM